MKPACCLGNCGSTVLHVIVHSEKQSLIPKHETMENLLLISEKSEQLVGCLDLEESQLIHATNVS